METTLNSLKIAIFSVILGFWCSNGFSAPNSRNLPPSLRPAALYHLDEGQGSATFDALGRTTATTTSVSWVFISTEKPGHKNSISFDGTNTFVDLGSYNNDFAIANTSLTFLCSIKTNLGDETISAKTNAGGTSDEFSFEVSANVLRLQGLTENGAQSTILFSGVKKPNDGKWHRVGFATQIAANGNRAVIYFDGKEDAESTYNSNTPAVTAQTFKLGKGFRASFNGIMEEPIIYSTMLSSGLVMNDFLQWQDRFTKSVQMQ